MLHTEEIFVKYEKLCYGNFTLGEFQNYIVSCSSSLKKKKKKNDKERKF